MVFGGYAFIDANDCDNNDLKTWSKKREGIFLNILLNERCKTVIRKWYAQKVKKTKIAYLTLVMNSKLVTLLK